MKNLLITLLVVLTSCSSPANQEICTNKINVKFLDKQKIDNVTLYLFRSDNKHISIQSCNNDYIKGEKYNICYLGDEHWEC